MSNFILNVMFTFLSSMNLKEHNRKVATNYTDITFHYWPICSVNISINMGLFWLPLNQIRTFINDTGFYGNYSPYPECQACHQWGYLRWLRSCLWSGWPSPESHARNVSLPMHTRFAHARTHAHHRWDPSRIWEILYNDWLKKRGCCWRGTAYLLIRTVFVMFYRAGANKDICTVERGNRVSMTQFKKKKDTNITVFPAGTITIWKMGE